MNLTITTELQTNNNNNNNFMSLFWADNFDIKCVVPQAPMAGTHNWTRNPRRDNDLGGLNVTPKGMYYITDQKQQ